MIDNEIPKSWTSTNLGAVCKLRNGFAFKSDRYTKEGIPVIRISDIGDGNVDLEYCVKVELDNQYLTYKVTKGDILVAMSGATTGKFGIFKSDQLAFQNQRVGRFEILDKSLLDNQFLLFLLYGLKHKILEDAYGGAQPNISSGKIEEMVIPLPPLAEQKRIVDKIEELFSELDKGIETLKTAQQQLKVYRQAVLKFAFEGKLTSPDVKDGELPDGWEYLKFGNVFEIFIGSTPSRKVPEYWNGSINWVSSGEVAFCNISKTKEKISEKGLENSSCKMHPPGTIILAMIGEGKTRGQAAILKCHSSHNQNTSAIRVNNEKYISELLYYYLVYTYEKNRGVGSGNNQKALNKERVKNFDIPMIPIKQQKELIQEIESRLSVCDKIEETILHGLKQAEALRQSILKKAFEGKLVSQDPNDEPASVLLEHIKAERAVAKPEKKIKTKKVKV